MKTAKAAASITQNIGLGYACFQGSIIGYVLLYRAAVNESVCEDSHTEHVQVATAAVSTPFRT